MKQTMFQGITGNVTETLYKLSETFIRLCILFSVSSHSKWKNY